MSGFGPAHFRSASTQPSVTRMGLLQAMQRFPGFNARSAPGSPGGCYRATFPKDARGEERGIRKQGWGGVTVLTSPGGCAGRARTVC